MNSFLVKLLQPILDGCGVYASLGWPELWGRVAVVLQWSGSWVMDDLTGAGWRVGNVGCKDQCR